MKIYAIFLLLSLSALPLRSDPVVDIPPHNHLDRPYPYSNQWVTWAWTGNSTPFVAAENKITKEMSDAVKAGRNPKAIVDNYGVLARRNPASALAQFKWVYASICWNA